MDRCRSLDWLVVTLLLLACTSLLAEDPAAEHPPAGKIRIANRAGDDFTSIQAALDAAPAGAVVLVGEGRFDEPLKIIKPVKLVGAGANRTVIGVAAELRECQLETFHARSREVGTWLDMASVRGGNILYDTKAAADAWAEMAALSVGIIKIENVRGVEIGSLRVTSPGTARADEKPIGGFPAIELNSADLRMRDCSIVGCLGNGVDVVGKSTLEIDDCLIAACWGSGVATSKMTGGLKIVNSDIRNCYNDDVMVGTTSDLFAIEGCRISGSAGFGLRIAGGRPTIRQNAIFENAQVGIAAHSDCMIKQNLIYSNEAGGALCLGEIKGLFAGNLFFDNDFVAIRACGACEPIIRRNVFIGSGIAVQYGPLQVQEPVGKYYVKENLFWRIDQPVERCHLAKKGKRPRTEAIELPAGAGNRVEDPQIGINAEGQVVLETKGPAEQIDLAGAAAVTTKSRWPLTDEERVLVLDDGTPDWSKWKKLPRAVEEKP